MEGKQEDYGLFTKACGALRPQYTNQRDKSKKRKREHSFVGETGQAPGLPPIAPKCRKNSKTKINLFRRKMGGGCSFPTSKNVIQPVVKKENFDDPEKGKDAKVARVAAGSTLSAVQLNINGKSGSRRGSLYEKREQNKDTEITNPQLLNFKKREYGDINVAGSSGISRYNSDTNPLCVDSKSEVKDRVGTQYSCPCLKSSNTYGYHLPRSNGMSRTPSPVVQVDAINVHGDVFVGIKNYAAIKSSSSSPVAISIRERTSLSESEAILNRHSRPNRSNSVQPSDKLTKSDENLALNKEQTMRYSVGSADLINNCCIGSTHLRPHNQPRAASVSGVTNELQPSASPRYRRIPTVENSVCFQEDDQINYYQILDEIGRGSYGSVYKCFSYKDKKYYAMKIISKKRIIRKTGLIARHPKKGKTNPLDALHREIAILKKVDHPNVVRLVEVIDDPQIDNVYMAFEIVEKGPIVEIPTDTPLPEEQTRQYCRDIALGLEYLHFSKIIHRDIKPSNLLLGDDGRVKIADFGVSDMFEDDDDMLNKFVGSPAFQSPESITGSRDKFSGKAADIWAFGVTLYCCVYGECPFYNSDVFKLYDMIKNNDVAFPDEPAVDPQFQDLVSRMLAKDPKTRITMSEIKNHSWITRGGSEPLPPTEAHCVVIEVTEDEVKKSVKLISKLSSLVLVKSMMRRRRLSIAKSLPPKFRSHSSPEFAVENTAQPTGKSDSLAPTGLR